MKKIILLIIVAITLVLPMAASAQLSAAGGKLDAVAGKSGLQGDLTVSLGTVISTVLSLLGTIFLLLMVYAGILWMTASGNDEKVDKAQSIVRAAIIGLIITMSAYAITYFVTSKVQSGGGGACGSSSATLCSGKAIGASVVDDSSGTTYVCSLHAGSNTQCDAVAQ